MSEFKKFGQPKDNQQGGQGNDADLDAIIKEIREDEEVAESEETGGAQGTQGAEAQEENRVIEQLKIDVEEQEKGKVAVDDGQAGGAGEGGNENNENLSAEDKRARAIKRAQNIIDANYEYVNEGMQGLTKFLNSPDRLEEDEYTKKEVERMIGKELDSLLGLVLSFIDQSGDIFFIENWRDQMMKDNDIIGAKEIVQAAEKKIKELEATLPRKLLERVQEENGGEGCGTGETNSAEVNFDEKFEELEEKKAVFEAMEKGEEKERLRKEYLEELQNFKESYKNFCYAEIGKGKSLDEIKPKYGVENEMKDEMKFMDPEKVKEVFGKQLEILMSEKEFDTEHILYEDGKREINAVLNMGQVLGFGKEKAFWNNLIFKPTKDEEKILYDLDKIKDDAEKLVKRELYFESLHKEGKEEGKKGILNKTKESVKWAGRLSGGMAQTMLTFKAAEMSVQWLANMPSITSAMGATAGSAAAIGASSFLLAGAGLYAGRGALKFVTEKWRNYGYEKQDLSTPETQERVKTAMANLISLAQMERFDEKANPDLAKDKKKFAKEKEQYINGKMEKEDWDKILDKRAQEQLGHKTKSELFRNAEEKKAVILLEKKAIERETGVARKIYSAVKDNPDLAKKFEKGGFWEGTKKVGAAYAKELGTLAAFEVPLLRPILMASGGGQEGKEFVKILFEGTKLYENNPKVRKLINTMGWTAGAVGMSFAFAPKAEGGTSSAKFAEKAGDLIWPTKAYAENAGGRNAGNKAGEAGWVASKFRGIIQEFKEGTDQTGALFSGKFKEFGNKWFGGFKERHGVKEKVESEESMYKSGVEEYLQLKEKYGEGTFEHGVLFDKINKLDGNLGDFSSKDLINFSKNRKGIMAEVESEIARHNAQQAKAPSAVKQETAHSKTETPSAAKTETLKPAQEQAQAPKAEAKQETGKSQAPTPKVETKTQPSATVMEKMNVKVKKGDTVWGIAEQVGKKLGIESSTTKNLSPEERAKNIFKRDAIKNFIVEIMKSDKKNPDLIKKGEKIEINIADLKSALDGSGILAKAEKLSKKDVENILDYKVKKKRIANIETAEKKLTARKDVKGKEKNINDQFEDALDAADKKFTSEQRGVFADIKLRGEIEFSDGQRGTSEKDVINFLRRKDEIIKRAQQEANAEIKSINNQFDKKLKKDEAKFTETEIKAGAKERLMENIKSHDENSGDLSIIDKKTYLGELGGPDGHPDSWVSEVKASIAQKTPYKAENSVSRDMTAKKNSVKEIVEKKLSKDEEVSFGQFRQVHPEASEVLYNTRMDVAAKARVGKEFGSLGEFEVKRNGKELQIIPKNMRDSVIKYNETEGKLEIGGYDYNIKEKDVFGSYLATLQKPAESGKLTSFKADGKGRMQTDVSEIKASWEGLRDYVLRDNKYQNQIGKENVKYITNTSGKLLPEQEKVVKYLVDHNYEVGKSGISSEKMGRCLELVGKKSLSETEKQLMAKFILRPSTMNAMQFVGNSGFRISPKIDEIKTNLRGDSMEITGASFKYNGQLISRKIYFDLKQGKFFEKSIFSRRFFDTATEYRQHLGEKYSKEIPWSNNK